MKRYRIKHVRKCFVIHIKRHGQWRRLWMYSFATESMARKFAEGTL